MEKFFSQVKGVLKTNVGYANGICEDTNYERLKETDHVEAVYIEYDKSIISLYELLENLFKVIDPTSVNRQAGDVGRQYRTGVYFVNKEDEKVINDFIKEEQKKYKEKIAVECEVLKNYVLAEEYHQGYLIKNPQGYCHI